jgi:hypothetical protein
MKTEHTSRRTRYGMPYRTGISAGTCADDFAACVKSGDEGSAACANFASSATCCPAKANK